ncbi:DUF4190 domain-containing protein [Akkermansiaceae bacterium]|nr:DUF4190 domain-containing protein [Akkermansiaceae bacterium]MDB4287695.1 DUF4190 domain-containing protein [bacterium]MDB4258057.1 DUF4190 domain-containing protein [Akkermansiaceae bacterium]MDB4267816.1 DUF4190 domain-containing protein [Akkermansiaceae bacterium]MDB4282575.1 DUF4190 domain-containing protein [Akkermansiaceae bacterium]
MDVSVPHTPSAPPVKMGTSGLAIASLILGLLGFVFCFITGIPAIITGHMARSRVKASGGTLGGGGIALAGIMLGYIMSFAVFLAAPAVIKAKKNADKAQLINQMKQVGITLSEYQSTPDGVYPKSPGELPVLKSHYKGDWYYFPKTDTNSFLNSPLLVSPISTQGFVILRTDGSLATKKKEEFESVISQGQGTPTVIPPSYKKK